MGFYHTSDVFFPLWQVPTKDTIRVPLNLFLKISGRTEMRQFICNKNGRSSRTEMVKR